MNMQKVTNWARVNWLIIVSCVVLIAALIVGPMFGSRLSKGLTAKVTKESEGSYNALARDTVPYTVPDPAQPGQALVTASLVPHAAHTARFSDLREREQREMVDDWTKAIDHNRADHTVLIEGLCPKPSLADERVLPGEFAKAYILRVHQALLDSIGARMPPEPEKVLADLQSYYQNQISHQLDTSGAEMTAEQKAELTKDLQRLRLSKYSQRASDATVYADVSIFHLPPLPTASPSLTQCWDWQVRYWIHEDIVHAVAKANETPSGDRGVPGAVVKRLVSVSVEDRNGQVQTPQGGPGYGGYGGYGDPYADPYAGAVDPGYDPYENPGAAPTGGAMAAETGPEIAPRNFNVSVTGRTSGEGSQNKHYDVRYVDVVAIVSSERLPLLLDAIAQTNFMTVVDLDLASIDPAEHLSAGFYYGRDPVVSATMRIETLWFREWTKPLMPAEVLENRGIPAPDPNAAPTPAPAPAPRSPSPRSPGGDDDLGLGPG
jgi:hypothetical protein